MKKHEQGSRHGCGCSAGCDRRDFLAAVGTAGALTFTAADDGQPAERSRNKTMFAMIALNLLRRELLSKHA